MKSANFRSLLLKWKTVQARSSRGGGAPEPPPLFGQRMPWPQVFILIFFVVSSCRMQGSVSKLNVPLRIWIRMGHKPCTLWHGVYLCQTPQYTCPEAAAIEVSVVSPCVCVCVCVWLPWALDLHHICIHAQSVQQTTPLPQVSRRL